MNRVEDIFSPLIGKIVFSIAQTYGSCFFIQVGDPYLRIRQPIEPKHAVTERSKALLRRRQVFVVGTWSILVQDCNWELASEGKSVCQDEAIGDMENLFRSVEGQYLVSVSCLEEMNSCTLEFDMGASLRLWPKPEARAGEDQWRIYYKDGSSVGYTNDGLIATEPKSDPDKI